LKILGPKSIDSKIKEENGEDFNYGEFSLLLEESRKKLEEGHKEGVTLRVYLVNIELSDESPKEIRESMRELGALVRTLGDECVGASLQKKEKPNPATLIGEGKVSAIRQSCKELNVDYVAFDRELSPSQVRNLEKAFHLPVIDRTGIILQIFKRNAKTKEAKTQIEIARLEYLYSRISNSWISWERQRGGGKSAGGAIQRGLGETFLEMEKRRFRDKITALRKELEKIRVTQNVKRSLREGALKIVLVGYTNAGKTTLMNALTNSMLSAKDSLFETLDSSVRTLQGSQGLNILLTDTVGFIKNLPHSLVVSFKSTLEETLHADLLIHVVDASQSHYKDHIKTTENVLNEIGVKDVPVLYIFNKMDRMAHEMNFGKILKKVYPNSLCISGQKEEDIEKVRQEILKFFKKDVVETQFSIDPKDTDLLSLIYSKARVLDSSWEEERVKFKVRMRKEIYESVFSAKRLELGEFS
jgi:GTP-binding protein HflX